MACLSRAGFAQRNCVLDVAPEALERVIDAGYDPSLGARAMKRAVERELTRPAAAKLAALATDELTIVSIRATSESLTVDVRAPGWAAKLPIVEAIPVESRIAAARNALGRANEKIASLRTRDAIISRRITPEQERYFALKELSGEIEEELDLLEEISESKQHLYLEARQPEATGRKVRYRAVKHFPTFDNYLGAQPFQSILSAIQMEEAIRELLDAAEPIDPDQDLFTIENRLALLSLMTSAPRDDQPTYLWIRGFPSGESDKPAENVKDIYQFAWNKGLGVEISMTRPIGLPKSDYLVEVKGHHARPLALTELGTHLVLPKHGGPIPVRVDVIDRWPAR